jgi:membrane-associated phospholipid phosphatase
MIRFALVLLALPVAAPLRAQQAAPAPPVHVIRWYEAGGAAAGILALMLVDEPVQRFAQRSRTATTDGIANVVRHVGQPEVYITVPVALVGAGLIADKPEIAKAGGRAAASLALAAAVELTLKVVIGRARPDSGLGSRHFDSFSVKARSMPSGHSALSWALMTSLAGEVRSPWLRAGCYTLAAGTAVSRVNDDRHWLSDIVAGSLIGFTAARLVRGKWQVFGLEPPRFLVLAPGERAIGVSLAF